MSARARTDWVKITQDRFVGAFRFAVPDKEKFFVRLLRAGLFLLIPVLGFIVLLGWQRRQILAARDGTLDLKPASLDDVKGGLPAFVNAIALWVIAGLVAVIFIVPAHLLLGRGWGNDVEGTVGPALQLIPMLLWPEILRRATLEENPFVWLRPGVSIERIRNHLGAYATVVVIHVVGALLGAAGLNVCCVGVLITLPLGMTVSAFGVAGWIRDAPEPSRPA